MHQPARAQPLAQRHRRRRPGRTARQRPRAAARTRARYDAKGLDGLDDAKFVDPSTLYAMLFGSEKFEDLIGELQIASMLQQAEKNAGDDPSFVPSAVCSS